MFGRKYVAAFVGWDVVIPMAHAPSGAGGLSALNITSGWFVAALATFTVGLAFATAAMWDWPRWRLVRRAVTLLLTQLMVLVTCGALINSRARFFSTLGDLFGMGATDGHGAWVPAGTPTLAPVASPAQRERLAAWVAAARRRSGPGRGVVAPPVFAGGRTGHRLPALLYLPDAYFTSPPAGQRFPVLQLLAGYPGTVESWTRSIGLADALDVQIAAGRLPALIAVAAEQNPLRGRDSECVDGADGSRAETFLARDVPEILLKHLPVAADRADWALMGYSTGGYCAVNLALRNPHRYAVAISLSGQFTPVSDRSTGDLYRGR